METTVLPLEKRGVFISVVFTFLTCGLFGIYWMVQFSNDLATYLGKEKSGGKEILFTLITCGLYGIYWNYKKGKDMADAQEKAGIRVADNSLIYLVISILGFVSIPLWVMQSDLNKIIEKQANGPIVVTDNN